MKLFNILWTFFGVRLQRSYNRMLHPQRQIEHKTLGWYEMPITGLLHQLKMVRTCKCTSFCANKVHHRSNRKDISSVRAHIHHGFSGAGGTPFPNAMRSFAVRATATSLGKKTFWTRNWHAFSPKSENRRPSAPKDFQSTVEFVPTNPKNRPTAPRGDRTWPSVCSTGTRQGDK